MALSPARVSHSLARLAVVGRTFLSATLRRVSCAGHHSLPCSHAPAPQARETPCFPAHLARHFHKTSVCIDSAEKPIVFKNFAPAITLFLLNTYVNSRLPPPPENCPESPKPCITPPTYRGLMLFRLCSSFSLQPSSLFSGYAPVYSLPSEALAKEGLRSVVSFCCFGLEVFLRPSAFSLQPCIGGVR